MLNFAEKDRILLHRIFQLRFRASIWASPALAYALALWVGGDPQRACTEVWAPLVEAAEAVGPGQCATACISKLLLPCEVRTAWCQLLGKPLGGHAKNSNEISYSFWLRLLRGLERTGVSFGHSESWQMKFERVFLQYLIPKIGVDTF